MTQQTYDIVIVGAGIVGTTLAAILKNSPLTVALIEAEPLPAPLIKPKQPFEPRVSALTVASQRLLMVLGAWSAIANQRMCAFKKMCVWDADGTGSIEFDCQDIGEEHIGFIVENRAIAAGLHTVLGQNAKNIQLIAPGRVVKISECGADDTTRQVELDDGRIIKGQLIVAADGPNSVIRQLAKVKVREWDYYQKAIVTTVRTELPHQFTAWQRFMPEGPLAFLPLYRADESHYSDRYCSIVWSSETAHSDALMALNDDDFAFALGQAFEYQLGSIDCVSRRYSFPLHQRHAVDYYQERLCLVGDAAHTIHPLAGQGVNLGLLDVAVLGEELVQAKRKQPDVGHISILKRYQRRRLGHNLAMLGVVEGFKHIFEQPNLSVRWLRNAGMRSLHSIPFVKNMIMSRAMALDVRIPEFSKDKPKIDPG